MASATEPYIHVYISAQAGKEVYCTDRPTKIIIDVIGGTNCRCDHTETNPTKNHIHSPIPTVYIHGQCTCTCLPLSGSYRCCDVV